MTLPASDRTHAGACFAALLRRGAFFASFLASALHLRMPANLHGLNDNFDLTSSHVLPARMRKAHEASRRGATRS